MFGGWFHSGQICMATQTAIVHHSIHDQFLELIKAHSPSLSAAPCDAPLRGLFTQASADRVREIVDDAIAKGAEVAAGSYEIKGNVVQPLLLKGVTSDMREFPSRGGFGAGERSG